MNLTRIFSFLPYALIVVFFIWYMYDRKIQAAEFQQKIDGIEQTRKNLEDSIVRLKTFTMERDSVLQNAIQQNNQIIESLNSSLKKINASSKTIDAAIKKNKTSIDNLWNDN